MPSSSTQDWNVRASRYHIVRSSAACPRCKLEGILVALMVPPEHELRSAEMDDAGPASEPGWETVSSSALLFHLEALPSAVEHRLGEQASTFKRAAGAVSLSGCWANHCSFCSQAWPDEDCFCEPGGAFLPASPEELEKLSIITVAEPFAALVGGYAPDPDFMAALIAP